MKKILILIILLFPTIVYGFQSSATSTTLMDITSNKVIYENNANEIRSVASISKIMTAILAIESHKLDNEITIKENVLKSYGSGIYIKVGEKLTLRDLVYGLLLRSGNDAAISIADNVSKNTSEFVNLMNKKASLIGMNNTTFNNPSGLDGDKMIGNLSTSHDMALLMSYCMKNKEFRKIIKTRIYNLKTNMNTYSWVNKNKLLKNYKYTTGGKTGFTKIAKRTLITTAKKGDTEFVVVTLNDGNDFQDHKHLFEEAFKIYKTYKILNKGNIVIPDEEFYSNRYFYIKNDFYYTMDKNEKNNILIKYLLDEKYKYNDNDKIGSIIIYNNNREVYRDNIHISLKKKKIKVIDYVIGLFK